MTISTEHTFGNLIVIGDKAIINRDFDGLRRIPGLVADALRRTLKEYHYVPMSIDVVDVPCDHDIRATYRVVVESKPVGTPEALDISTACKLLQDLLQTRIDNLIESVQ